MSVASSPASTRVRSWARKSEIRSRTVACRPRAEPAAPGCWGEGPRAAKTAPGRSLADRPERAGAPLRQLRAQLTEEVLDPGAERCELAGGKGGEELLLGRREECEELSRVEDRPARALDRLEASATLFKALLELPDPRRQLPGELFGPLARGWRPRASDLAHQLDEHRLAAATEAPLDATPETAEPDVDADETHDILPRELEPCRGRPALPDEVDLPVHAGPGAVSAAPHIGCEATGGGDPAEPGGDLVILTVELRG